MKNHVLDRKKYAALARKAAAEGIVMLRNEGGALPLKKGDMVSLFGRLQFDYYKSGTGSGGMVNAPYVVSIFDAISACSHIRLNKKLLRVYEQWVADNPFDRGSAGFAGEPWSQKEMPITKAIVAQAAESSDAAVVVIGRSAGECRDNENVKGSYLLTDTEEHLIELVCKNFSRSIILLNMGNIIDMKWVEKYKPSSVLYVWQGGQEGGNAVCDVLTGAVNPSGRLSDTIARNIEDYPSTANFGDTAVNYYKEDIYVGYRYFETAAKDKVLYPFGFGLSYTRFEISGEASFGTTDGGITADSCASIRINVRNIGKLHGKEAAQVYISAPQGKLGKPSRTLVGFVKTKELKPGETQIIDIKIPLAQMASYDDSGVTGHKSCYVLEAGEYVIYVGSNVRDAVRSGGFFVEEAIVTQRLSPALVPVRPFERLKPSAVSTGSSPEYEMTNEPVPTRTYSLSDRIRENMPESVPYAGSEAPVKHKLSDVVGGKVTMEEFTAQLSDEELCCLVRGEGMSSPKVIPGSTGIFGGVTDALAEYGIPIACCVDGPSGIRLDSGAPALSLPGGTALACTFNTALITDLFDMLGREMRGYDIDVILAPGMNLHRNPLCGRNFEYYSEDPLLTGKIAAAQLRGLHKHNVTGTIKHFAANNQELERYNADSVVSERALREIYLKGFEIAVREGGAMAVMTTYGPVNGLWTAGSYDLCTTILRGEWGFDGVVVTDWWAYINEEGGEPSGKKLAQMVRAQNDVYMLVRDSLTSQDNLAEGLKTGAVTRGELLRSAGNICKTLTRLAVMDRYLNFDTEAKAQEEALRLEAARDEVFEPCIDTISVTPGGSYSFDVSKIDTAMRSYNNYSLALGQPGKYKLSMRYKSGNDKFSQNPVALLIGSYPIWVYVMSGTEGEWTDVEAGVELPADGCLRLFFSHGGLEFERIELS